MLHRLRVLTQHAARHKARLLSTRWTKNLGSSSGECEPFVLYMCRVHVPLSVCWSDALAKLITEVDRPRPSGISASSASSASCRFISHLFHPFIAHPFREKFALYVHLINMIGRSQRRALRMLKVQHGLRDAHQLLQGWKTRAI